jgi:emfourin
MPGGRSGSSSSRPKRLRVTIGIDGGFAYLPGLAQPRVVDAAALPADAVALLRSLLAAPTPRTCEAPDASRGADRRSYVIRIEEGTRRRTVTVTDPVADPGLAELIDVLLSTARAAAR